jgi:hypothetical protein
LLALLVTGNHFSVSSDVGFLALFGVAVQTGVILVECINQLRAGGMSVEEAAIEGSVLRFRPIVMTMIVASLGLLPAALSHGIGFSTAFCDCHCRRTTHRSFSQRAAATHPLCLACALKTSCAESLAPG